MGTRGGQADITPGSRPVAVVRHRRTFGIFFAWCVAAIAASGPLLTEGVDALKRNDPATAELKFKEEVKAHPDDAEAAEKPSALAAATRKNSPKPTPRTIVPWRWLRVRTASSISMEAI